MRSASLAILHETSFTIGFATNALLICANLQPQTSNGDLRVAVFASELIQLKLLVAWRICFCGNNLNKPAAWLVNRQIRFVRNALPVNISLLYSALSLYKICQSARAGINKHISWINKIVAKRVLLVARV